MKSAIILLLVLSCNIQTKRDNTECLNVFYNENRHDVILEVNNLPVPFQMGQVKSDFNKNALNLSDWTKSKFIINENEMFEFDSICMTWNEFQFKNKYIITEDSIFFEHLNTEKSEMAVLKMKNNDKNYSRFLGLFVIKFLKFDINKLIDESSTNDLVFSIKIKNKIWRIYNLSVNNVFEIHTFYNIFDYRFAILKNH